MGTPLHELGEIRIAVECCILHDNSVLLQRRSPDSKFFPNFLCFPGGHVDHGENAQEAIIREVFEETGIQIPLNRLQLRLISTNYHTDRKMTWVVFAFTTVLESLVPPINSAEGKCEWFSLSNLDRSQIVHPVTEHFDYMIQTDAKVLFTAADYSGGKMITK